MDAWLDQLAALQGAPAYGLLFALLVSCGIGAPMNEDIVLLVAAALTLSGVMEPLPLIAVAWAGLVLGDALVFHWGHRFGPRILGTRFVSRIVAPQRLAEFQGRVRRGGPAYIFVIRFMPGIRTALFFAAGTLKIRYRTFFLFDGLGAAIELPLLVYGVRFVGGRWQEILAAVQRFQLVLLIGLAALAVLVLALRSLRKRGRAAANPTDAKNPP
jgi:membrane protein DedA with SNARE-associated domain